MDATTFAGSAVGPADPNDKAGSKGVGPQQYIAGATPLRYAVFFGNEPTATAPAQKVIVTDQLNPSSEDFTTFNLGPITLPNQLVSPSPGPGDFSTTVDLRPSNDVLVGINAHLDMSIGLVTWTFQSLDPTTNRPTTDPTAGFLPPGANGSVFFTVMPKQGLATNTQIQNQATIVFDVNAPMSTQTWLNTLDNTAPTSHFLALPLIENSLSFPVQWKGTDVGSGVQDFTIFVSDNGGSFSAFQTNTAATSATFTGQANHTYSFYSIARDFVGNVEGAKSVAEATTQVVTDTTPPVTTASASPGPNANGWNNTDVTVTFSATDNEQGGTGVKQITYSTSGAQNIASAVATGASTSFTINTEGITTITFFGTDNAGNVERAKTLTVKLDKTPPSIVGSSTPEPNANGWNNTNVTVSFQCTDSLSGLAAGSPPPPTVLSTEGAGQSMNGACQDLAGNSAAAAVGGINIDKTPPNIVGSSMPGPNANGWNNTNVTVSFQCNDSLSGLAAGSPPAPTVLSMEGAGQSVSGACQDLAGNSSAVTLSGINIDKTPPEAFNQFDPVTKDVALFGRDSLSGVAPGPVQPLSIVSLGRDKDGDDEDDRGSRDEDDLKVELRTYQVFDLAGNSLLLVEKVKKQGRHISVLMMTLQYGQGSVVSLPRNRQSFEWELAEEGSLKELDEKLSIDAESDEQRVEADFDARTNQTIVVHEEPEPKTKLIKPGLDLLRMATAAGKLSIEF